METIKLSSQGIQEGSPMEKTKKVRRFHLTVRWPPNRFYMEGETHG
jgi:hypothetical protein